MNSTPTVTIGIPAYNEEGNIGFLLRALLAQRQVGWKLKELFVLADACTDRTVEVAKNIAQNDRRLRIIDHRKRMGKHRLLLELYRRARGDFVLSIDADTLPADSKVLSLMVCPFKDGRVAYVAADREPLAERTTVEHLVNTWDTMWAAATNNIKHGHSIYHTFSCAVMLRRDFARTITSFPRGLVSEARYFYFRALAAGKRFRFAPQAVVRYRSPSTVHEYVARVKRASGQREILRREFKTLVNAEYIPIPWNQKVRVIAFGLRRQPFSTLSTIVFHQVILKFFGWKREFEKSGFWTPAPSTKLLVNPTTSA